MNGVKVELLQEHGRDQISSRNPERTTKSTDFSRAIDDFDSHANLTLNRSSPPSSMHRMH
ncbi:Uncharacterized protein TCM_005802 [Theobroma cacao]|uniref:Uncharacterized protein n=1 Tax=Theobroma cacao TaxID=3641 RepID=A0A061DWY1_THECC|nr:Uncharacterized protein TCM_005802 [Theobroma cacao]